MGRNVIVPLGDDDDDDEDGKKGEVYQKTRFAFPCDDEKC